MITQNPLKRILNKVNRLKTLENLLMKTFRGFRVFKYGLWQKTKTRNAEDQ